MNRTRRYYRVRAIVRVAFWLSLFAIITLVSCGLWWNGHGYTLGFNPYK
jgi:Ni,Fe-hydrogenase I cytochrome b subunit